MELINLKSLNLTMEESKDIINYIAQKKGISTKKLLSTIKPNPKHKNNKILTTETQQKAAKIHQKAAKIHRKAVKIHEKKTHEKIKKTHEKIKKTQQVAKTQQKVAKTQQELTKTQQKSLKLQKHKNTQNLTYEKPSKLAKRENLTSQKQQIMFKNKKRIEIIMEKLKELRHKLSKNDLKKIKKHLYNIENKKELLESETTKEYFDELDKKILELDEYYNDDDDFEFKGIENVQDLFKILTIDEYLALMLKIIYEPTLVKSGFNNNYIEYRGEGNEIFTFEKYLDLIEPYLGESINDYKSKGEWKIQLTAQINFISSRLGSDETRVMHTRSVNEEFTNGSDTDEIIKELFKSLLQRYQENLLEKLRDSDFVTDGVNFLYYDFNKISISSGGSYIDSPKWLKDKKSTINQKNNDNKCFQYAVTLALNLDKINDHPERISKLKLFIEEYNWKDIDFPSTSKDWKKFETNNEVVLNILYVPHNTKKIEIAYKSKHNLTREKQVILLMISNGENWHYLTVKNLSRLLRRITSNHDGDFYCLNCFHSYRTKNKLEVHKKICENRDYCHVEMPTNDNNTIKYNQGEKSIKLPFIVYAALECLLEKMSTSYNNAEESSTTKINKHTPSGYSIFTHCSFDKSKKKLNYYRGEDFMTKFCKDLREHATKIINYEKKSYDTINKKRKRKLQ